MSGDPVGRFVVGSRGCAHRQGEPSRFDQKYRRLACGESKRREWLLSEGSNLLGRDRDCVVRIDSPSVSRHHARIVVTRGEATVEDLGSKNGTYVDGQPVTVPVALEDRVRLRVGSVKMTYRIVSALPSTVTQRRV